MNNYQLDYAAGRPQMYDYSSRKRKALRMVKALANHFGDEKNLKKLTVLDIGSSTGIIDSVLAKNFKKVLGTDIDKNAVSFAKKNFGSKNLEFKVEDAMKLSFKNNSFDVIICSQIYEHVPDSTKLFSEIYRVLKKDGVCYLAALNRLWPLEPHYNLPFLSWLPKPLANIYMRATGKGGKYFETPETYWKLKTLTKKFTPIDYTEKILKNPKKFAYPEIPKFISLISPLLKYLTPTFFWILIKED